MVNPIHTETFILAWIGDALVIVNFTVSTFESWNTDYINCEWVNTTTECEYKDHRSSWRFDCLSLGSTWDNTSGRPEKPQLLFKKEPREASVVTTPSLESM